MAFRVKDKSLKEKVYEIPERKSKDKIDIIELGSVEPIFVPIEWEMSNHFDWENITIVNYHSSEPALMQFGNAKTEDYLDKSKIDIPLVRAASSFGNPYYMDSGLKMFDIHISETHEKYQEIPHIFNQAIINVLEKEGIYAVYRETKGIKLYVETESGYDKISSGQLAEGHFWTYLNLDTNYNKYKDYYKKSVKPTSDDVGLGLQTYYDDDFKNIESDIIKEFVKLMGYTSKKREYTKQEKTKIEKLKEIHSDSNWVDNIQRNDVFFHYKPNVPNLEIEVELDSKPNSNKILYEIDDKSLRYFKQDANIDRVNSIRAQNIIGSYAVYNDDLSEKKFHIYRPWAKDSAGNETWCELIIPTKQDYVISPNGDKNFGDTGKINGDAYIEIPQDFLDKAKYPVIVDPTIGYTTMGASSLSVLNKIRFWTTFETIVGRPYEIHAYYAGGLWQAGAKIQIGSYLSFFGSYLNISYSLNEVHNVTGNPVWDVHYPTGNFEKLGTSTLELGETVAIWGNTGGYETVRYDSAGAFLFGNSVTKTYNGVMPDVDSGDLDGTNNERISVYFTYRKSPRITLQNSQLTIQNSTITVQ